MRIEFYSRRENNISKTSKQNDNIGRTEKLSPVYTEVFLNNANDTDDVTDIIITSSNNRLT